MNPPALTTDAEPDDCFSLDTAGFSSFAERRALDRGRLSLLRSLLGLCFGDTRAASRFPPLPVLAETSLRGEDGDFGTSSDFPLRLSIDSGWIRIFAFCLVGETRGEMMSAAPGLSCTGRWDRFRDEGDFCRAAPGPKLIESALRVCCTPLLSRDGEGIAGSGIGKTDS
jgi:hypothetical protein